MDAGLSLQPKRPALTETDKQQRLAKARLILDAFADADAIVVGATDWALGSDWLLAQIDATHAPVLAANLICEGKAPFPASRVIERAGRRIGVVGVTAGDVAGCEVSEPGAALTQAVGDLGDVDAVIVLVPLDRADLVKGVVEAGSAITLVLDGSGRYGTSGVVSVGEAWATGAGTRGKHVGQVELVFVPGASGWRPVGSEAATKQRVESLSKRLSALDEQIASGDPENRRTKALTGQRARVDKELQTAKEALVPAADAGTTHQIRATQTALAEGIADHAPTLAAVAAVQKQLTEGLAAPSAVRVVTESTSSYAGAQACVACHEQATQQWQKTRHAAAYQTLAVDNHAADTSCVPCHVTGFGQPSGPTTPMNVGGLRDVQCEACHGPARAHVSNAADPAALPNKDPGEAVCQTCHDNERDEGRFDFPAYRSKVVHTPAP